MKFQQKQKKTQEQIKMEKNADFPAGQLGTQAMCPKLASWPISFQMPLRYSKKSVRKCIGCLLAHFLLSSLKI